LKGFNKYLGSDPKRVGEVQQKFDVAVKSEGPVPKPDEVQRLGTNPEIVKAIAKYQVGTSVKGAFLGQYREAWGETGLR
jgi:hypothetical protein